LNTLKSKVSGNFKKHTLKKLMTIWMRALDNEAKVKVMERNRDDLYKQKVFATFLRMVRISMLTKTNFAKRHIDNKMIAFTALVNYTLRNKKLRMASSEIMYQATQRTQSRSFMGLRYQTLIMKNQRIL
jgi:hypothetical protein